MIKDIICKGIGFHPNSTRFMPVHGFLSEVATLPTVIDRELIGDGDAHRKKRKRRTTHDLYRDIERTLRGEPDEVVGAPHVVVPEPVYDTANLDAALAAFTQAARDQQALTRAVEAFGAQIAEYEEQQIREDDEEVWRLV